MDFLLRMRARNTWRALVYTHGERERKRERGRERKRERKRRGKRGAGEEGRERDNGKGYRRMEFAVRRAGALFMIAAMYYV
jgi:hypothetical protein